MENKQTGYPCRLARVFVSSTFRDMQAERDALNRLVLPYVRAHGRKLGVDVALIDLRWGVTKEEAEKGLTAALCFGEVEACRPFFLGMVGDRYGWVPETYTAGELARFPWIRPERRRSITELEMERGAFDAPRGETHAAFLVKGVPQGCEGERARRNALARRAMESGYPAAEYEDIPSFIQRAKELLTGMLDAAFAHLPRYTPAQGEDELHAWYRETAARSFIGRAEAMEALDAFVKGPGGLLLVTGEPGCGKSALLAAWASARPSTETTAVHFAAAAPVSTWRDAALRLIRLLGGEAGGEALRDDSAVRRALRTALGQAGKAGRVTVVIDGAERLDAGDAGFTWLPEEPIPNVHLVVSAGGERALAKLKALRHGELYLPPLSPGERAAVARRYLGAYAKRLDAAQCALLCDCKNCGNPRFLLTLLNELRLTGSFEELDDRLRFYLASRSLNALFDKVTARLAGDYPDAARVLPVLSLAPAGIGESELPGLCGVSQAAWSGLRLALERYLFGGSMVRLASDGLEAAARRRFLPAREDGRAVYRRLMEFYQREDDERRAALLPECCLALGDTPGLLRLLEEPGVLRELRQRSAYRLGEYVSAVQERTGQRLAQGYAGREEEIAALPPETAFAVARCLLDAGESDVPRRLLAALCQRFSQAEDRENEQLARGLLAHVYHKNGEYAKAEALYERKGELCRALGNRLEEAKALSNLGVERWMTGNLTGAKETFEEARALCHQLGYAEGEQINLGQKAHIAYLTGACQEAEALYGEQRRLCQAAGNPYGLAAALGGLGLTAFRTGREDRALRLFMEQAELCQRSANPDGRQTALGNAALVFMRQGDYRRAIPLLNEKRALCEKGGNAQGLSTALFNLAQVKAAQGELTQAEALAEERARLVKERRMPEQVSGAQYQAALIKEALGDLAGARARALEALAAAGQCGQREALERAREFINRLPKV